MHSAIFVCFALAVVTVCAQMSQPPSYKERYPTTYKFAKQLRHPRDVTWDTKVGKGKIFGTLGDNDQGLFGRGGYKQDIFNDDRGRLQGQAYGSRVLGPYGDTSNFGGKLDWANKDAKAALDISKQIGGRTSLSADAAKVWNLDKNTYLSAGGSLKQDLGHGKPDIAVQGEFRHDW